MNVGSLFSGIGGFDLGLERAGMRVVWQCEQDAFCRRVLARHWPDIPCHPDVRALVADTRGARRRQDVRGAHGDESADAGWGSPHADVAERGGEGDGAGEVVPVPVPYVDVLCGGFPCQDISLAGRGAGIQGERSGLWAEFARLIRDIRPRYVIVENVAALLARGLDVVLSDLAACGYDAEWDCIPASAVGAPHRRDRVWLVAYPGGEQHKSAGHENGRPATAGLSKAAPDPFGEGELQPQGTEPEVGRWFGDSGGWWAVEPPVGRVAHGVPDRLDQLAALGNALVPQIAEWLGRRILEWEAMNQ